MLVSRQTRSSGSMTAQAVQRQQPCATNAKVVFSVRPGAAGLHYFQRAGGPERPGRCAGVLCQSGTMSCEALLHVISRRHSRHFLQMHADAGFECHMQGRPDIKVLADWQSQSNLGECCACSKYLRVASSIGTSSLSKIMKTCGGRKSHHMWACVRSITEPDV